MLLFFLFFLQGGEGLVFQNVKVLGVINISLAFRQVFFIFCFFGCKINKSSKFACSSSALCANLRNPLQKE